MRILFSLVALGLLTACASTDSSKAGAAVTTPLSDLNLVSANIPIVLEAAQRAPYELPPALDCDSLAADIKALDEVLGPDLDAPPTAGNPGLLERGAEAGSDAAFGALQRTAEGVIPFRGWVRKLSGAERHSRKVAAAITAGGVRRAFLKGLRASRSCRA